MLLKTIAHQQPTKAWPVPQHQPPGNHLPSVFAEHSAAWCGISCSAGVICDGRALSQCLAQPQLSWWWGGVRRRKGLESV